MSDERWLDVHSDLCAAERHLGNGLLIFDAGNLTDDTLESYQRRMALMHAFMAGYTSIEAALLRTLRMLSEAEPTGPDWHAVLLRRVCTEAPDRPAILEADVCKGLDELRRFRHVAMHVYEDFEPQRAQRAVNAARGVLPRLKPSLETFKAVIDPD